MLHNPIKGNRIQDTIQAYTCPYADHQPMGVSKGQTFYLKVVMLHIKLKGIKTEHHASLV